MLSSLNNLFLIEVKSDGLMCFLAIVSRDPWVLIDDGTAIPASIHESTILCDAILFIGLVGKGKSRGSVDEGSLSSISIK